jgi:CopG family nickel-responsive transcriptional regulator
MLAKTEGGVARISVSLPGPLVNELDKMVADKGFASRSHAIGEILHKSLTDHARDLGNDVMLGTITLFYKNSVPGLQKALADLQFEHIDEVVSSLHVHLLHNQTMEVILVQGPVKTLQAIADKMITKRGVISGQMNLIAALIPQVHPFKTGNIMEPLRCF